MFPVQDVSIDMTSGLFFWATCVQINFIENQSFKVIQLKGISLFHNFSTIPVNNESNIYIYILAKGIIHYVHTCIYTHVYVCMCIYIYNE